MNASLQLMSRSSAGHPATRGSCQAGFAYHSSAPSSFQPKRRFELHTCQAHPRRVAKVASQIKREIGEMLILDDVVAAAVCPERRRGFDGALSALASVTDVYVSRDLQVVKAYVSIYSDPAGKERAMANLKRLEPYVRSQIGARVKLRLTPLIRFELDNSLEEAEAVEAAIGKEDFNKYIREAQGEVGSEDNPPPAAAAAAAAEEASVAEVEEDDGFFDDLGEDDGWEVEEYGAWAQRPGPFDDLFRGNADGPLIQQRKPAAAKKKRRKPALGKKRSVAGPPPGAAAGGS